MAAEQVKSGWWKYNVFSIQVIVVQAVGFSMYNVTREYWEGTASI